MSQLAQEAFSGFAKEGGRVGSGTLGAGTGGVARCAC
ncbi:sulfate adenylyltransferase subunit 1 [Actinacidiphila rubida]|uniref:Sulfate adenylyltransferase subunit 1 n=1 Tax=Actinacidiphila rubida TaxID=310780 RepID=A0A1H8FPP4_9ACTN|nr:sulfate adenylyltransferase subunit 1 [Actinacidiphila rubida]